MARFILLLLKFGNNLGQVVELSKIQNPLNVYKQLKTIIITSICKGIEPLKLDFPTQVTYNQPSQYISKNKENHARRETSVIGVYKVHWFVKQTLNSTNKKTHTGQKEFAFIKTQAIIPAFAKTRPITPQNIAHLNHHKNSNVVLLAIVQYTLHIGNFAKCKTIVQTSKQQGANGQLAYYEALIS